MGRPLDWFDKFIDNAVRGNVREMKKILSRAPWRRGAILWNMSVPWDSSGAPFLTTVMFLCTRRKDGESTRVVIPEMLDSARFLTELWAESGCPDLGSPWSDFSHPLSMFSVSDPEMSPPVLSLVSDMCIMGMSLKNSLRSTRSDMVASSRPGLQALLIKGPMSGVIVSCENGDKELARALLDSVFRYPQFQDVKEWASDKKLVSALMRSGMFEEVSRLSPEQVGYNDLIRGQEVRQENGLPPFRVPDDWWSCLAGEETFPLLLKGERGLDKGFVAFCRLAAKGEKSEGRTAFLKELASKSVFPERCSDAGSALLNLLANDESDMLRLMSGTTVSISAHSCMEVLREIGDVPRCDEAVSMMLDHEIVFNEWFSMSVHELAKAYGTPTMASRVSSILERMGWSAERLVSGSSASLGKVAASEIESFLLMSKAVSKDMSPRRGL